MEDMRAPIECPFCKDQHPEIESDGNPQQPLYFVLCLKCGATGPSAKTRMDARQAWNKRGIILT